MVVWPWRRSPWGEALLAGAAAFGWDEFFRSVRLREMQAARVEPGPEVIGIGGLRAPCRAVLSTTKS